MKCFLIVIACYLIGSVPFSYLFSKLKGKDPRKGGTGNVGASNVLVVAGPYLAVLALVGDLAKGFLAVQVARFFDLSALGIILASFSVILGHDFSIFLRFDGGKGIATSLGILLALDPILLLIVLLLWLITVLVLRYIIPSTITVMALVPAIMWMGSWSKEYILFAFAAFLLAVYTHRRDLQRFFAGQELTVQQSIAKYLKK
jgi:glycerol-3-phosphate acyltransferase PlsY